MTEPIRIKRTRYLNESPYSPCLLRVLLALALLLALLLVAVQRAAADPATVVEDRTVNGVRVVVDSDGGVYIFLKTSSAGVGRTAPSIVVQVPTSVVIVRGDHHWHGQQISNHLRPRYWPSGGAVSRRALPVAVPGVRAAWPRGIQHPTGRERPQHER